MRFERIRIEVIQGWVRLRRGLEWGQAPKNERILNAIC